MVATSLKKYEALKPLARQLRAATDSLRAVNGGLHRVIVYQDSAQVRTDRVVAYTRVLYLDADTKAQAWRRTARSRWWSCLGLGVVALLFGAAAVR